MVGYELYKTRYPIKVFPEKPSSENEESESSGELYEVRIIDNDYNTYEEVMEICMTALGITRAEAYAIAWEVDHVGSCVVALGSLDEAESVAQIIRTIGIDVQVNPVRIH